MDVISLVDCSLQAREGSGLHKGQLSDWRHLQEGSLFHLDCQEKETSSHTRFKHKPGKSCAPQTVE